MEFRRRLAIANSATTSVLGASGEIPEFDAPEQSPVTAELAAIREIVGKLRGVLLEPSIIASSTLIDACLPDLEAAAERLKAVAQVIEHDPQDHVRRFGLDGKSRVSEELAALRQELLRAEVLRRNGVEFWNSWARLLGMELGSDTGAGTIYTSSGTASVPAGWSVLSSGERVQVEG